MDLSVAEELERFIEQDALWEAAGIERCRRQLEAYDRGTPAETLLHSFAALRLRLEEGTVPEPLRRDAEAVVYPGLWKIIEAVRDGLPAGEQLARTRTLNRRLAHLFAGEDRPG